LIWVRKIKSFNGEAERSREDQKITKIFLGLTQNKSFKVLSAEPVKGP